MLVVSADGDAIVWDRHHPTKAVATLKRDQTVVMSTAVSLSGTRIVTAGADGTARVSDAARGGAVLVVLNVNGATAACRPPVTAPDQPRGPTGPGPVERLNRGSPDGIRRPR